MMRANGIRIGVIGEGMEVQIAVLLLKIQGEGLNHIQTPINQPSKTREVTSSTSVFTLDGAFVCGLIAPH
jgi:hypothetical protein